MTRRNVLGFFGGLLLAIAGCGVPESIDRAADMIDDAADRVISLPEAKWRALAEKLVADLERMGQSTLRAEVNQVVQGAILVASSEYRCDVDFTVKRLAAALKRIVAARRGKPVTPESPAICGANPSSIDVGLPAERRQKLEFLGYDLTPGTVELWIVNLDGSSTNVTGSVSGVSPYLWVANLSETGVRISRGTKAIELRWAGGVLSTVPVTYTPILRDEVIALPVEEFVPPSTPKHWEETRWRRGGREGDPSSYTVNRSSDNEFKGHGPCVSGGAEIRVVEGRHIQTRIWMDAYECHGDMKEQDDFTHASGERGWTTVYSFPAGTEVIELLFAEKSISVPVFRMDGDAPRTAYGRSFVKFFRFWGDHGGDEAGTFTRIQVHYEPIRIKVRVN